MHRFGAEQAQHGRADVASLCSAASSSSRAAVSPSAATAVRPEAGFVVRVVSATAGAVGAERAAGKISIVHGAATAAGMFVG
ncbi:hypothetical protein A5767_10855 [Rhodococcus sp. 852002-51564_SCH6189132-a]|nr:hypothetical protein A5767_10855 [Rhodococcus sp. 852002-51564_SCH6189132-a]